MKHSIIFWPSIALTLLTAPSASRAEQPEWTVQVDPLTAALGFPHLLLERAVAASVSVYAGPHLRLYDNVFGNTREAFTGLGVEAGVRWYPQERAPTGFWVGIRVVGARLSTSETSRFGGYASVLGGYAWILAQRWSISLALGGQYIDYSIAGLGTRGWLPAAHTAIGVAF